MPDKTKGYDIMNVHDPRYDFRANLLGCIFFPFTSYFYPHIHSGSKTCTSFLNYQIVFYV